MRRIFLFATLALGACRGSSDNRATPGKDTLVVFTAASLSAPVRVVLDSFAEHNPVVVQEEHGASLELARRITALGRVPDVVALADQEVFPELLMPRSTSWYAAFARNRMVVAFTDRSTDASSITPTNWYEVLLRPEVSVGRSDPSIAPVGYRALLSYELAEKLYGKPGLAKQLAAKTPPSHIRGNATELAALLSAGELDYIVDYESLAKAQGFRYVTLPADVDLSDPGKAAAYASASVRVPRLTDSVTRKGAPILYGVSIPRHAPHPTVGERFLAFLLGDQGKAIMRARAIDMLDAPIVVGDSAPAFLSRGR